MSISCLKFFSLIIVLVSLSLFFTPSVAFAARSINSASLNGSSSVSVSPSASVNASVTVTTSGSGSANDWNSTSWSISSGASGCRDHANYTATGTFSESFSLTAPFSAGTYSVSFIAYQNDGCASSPSSTYTLNNGIVSTTIISVFEIPILPAISWALPITEKFPSSNFFFEV